MRNQQGVSLCMITKNEENCITDCIMSVRPLIHEIIVVDTGSTDHTVRKATELGAKVFHYPWQGDFGQARNFALEQATGDWILVLDGDEILAPISWGIFQQMLQNPQVEGYLIEIESYIGTGEEQIFDQVVRLFRNKRNYRFVGAIHEQVIGSIREGNQGQGIKVANKECKIIHTGYLDHKVAEKNKHDRNSRVINEALRKNPVDPFLHYSLGMEYVQQGEIQQASKAFAESLKYLTGGEGYFSSVLVNIAAGMLQQGQYKEGETFIAQALRMLPQNGDLLLLQGMANLYQKNYSAGISLLQQSIVGREELAFVSSIHSLCGDLYAMLEYYQQAEEEYFMALQGACHCLYPLLQLIGLKQRGKSQKSWYALSQFTTRSNSKKLQVQLLQQQEVHLVLVLALLNIMNVLPTDQNAQNPACQEYLQLLRLYQPADDLGKEVLDYLRYSGEILWLYAQGQTIFTGGLFPAEKKIQDIITASLDVISKTLCPTWIPCLTLHQKSELNAPLV